MNDPVRWSHYGWLWFCPIYWSDDSEVLAERHWVFVPVYWLAMQLEQLRIFVTSLLDLDYESTFTLKLRPLPRKETLK